LCYGIYLTELLLKEKVKTFHLLLIALYLAVALTGCSHYNLNRDVIFQTSTINALLEGIYDGDVTFDRLKKYGDFGIGTFNNLDGEMLELEGNVYQMRVDGKAYRVPDSMKTPFAVVTFFEADKRVILNKKVDYKGLNEFLDGVTPSKNIFYAVKIDGTFSYIKARSVPSQKKPYPKLVDAVKKQAIVEFRNVKGTLAGFYLPEYMKGINVTGYHFHFITKDRTAGGHTLACQVEDATVAIDYTNGFYMVLPEGEGFFRVDLGKEKQRELEEVEYAK